MSKKNVMKQFMYKQFSLGVDWMYWMVFSFYFKKQTKAVKREPTPKLKEFG
ncbi:MAG: hypothetical protein HOO06_01690 [Bdellovibrionaceae bacterium]|nr:hypothetical protein [Pseudobdellovibrionaceae bacterium]